MPKNLVWDLRYGSIKMCKRRSRSYCNRKEYQLFFSKNHALQELVKQSTKINKLKKRKKNHANLKSTLMIEKSSCVFVLLSKTVEIGRYSHCIIDCVIFFTVRPWNRHKLRIRLQCGTIIFSVKKWLRSRHSTNDSLLGIWKTQRSAIMQ